MRVFLAGVSDGQKKAGVDAAPHAIIDHLKETPSNWKVVNVADWNAEMETLHKRHLKSFPSESELTEADSESFVAMHQSERVAAATRALSDAIQRECTSNNTEFVLTVGGDHSIAMGSIAGLAKLRGPLTVVWIDAHADFHSPRTTPTGNLHGCPVGFLTGLPGCLSLAPFQWLYQSDGSHDYIADLIYIGLRDVEDEEVEHMRDVGARALWMADIPPEANQKDFVAEWLANELSLMTKNTSVHCSFDIDALDPTYAPSTGTPVPKGLSLETGVQIIDTLKQTGRFHSMDLVEVNPRIGNSGDVSQTLDSACVLLRSLRCQ